MIVFAILDRGRIISPAYGRLDPVRVARLRRVASRSPLASGARQIMAINVKVVERPIEDVSYVRATLKGMALTFKHLVNPHKVTVQYPEEKNGRSRRGGAARTGC